MPPMSPYLYLSRLPKCVPRLSLCAGIQRLAIVRRLDRGRFDGGVSPLKDVLAAYALRSFELELTKHDAADLAGQRLRQVGDELDAPRVGIG